MPPDIGLFKSLLVVVHIPLGLIGSSNKPTHVPESREWDA
jgi:hypothetical protein